jgi:hypothetical protein
VVELTHRRLTDRANGYQLIGHFTYPDDKEAVQAMLASE